MLVNNEINELVCDVATFNHFRMMIFVGVVAIFACYSLLCRVRLVYFSFSHFYYYFELYALVLCITHMKFTKYIESA